MPKTTNKTMKEQLADVTVVEKAQALAPKTWRLALDSILADTAKSAQKIVVTGTENILRTLERSTHNWFACGEELVNIALAVNERQFSRLINEVFTRFGLSKPTCYRWMANVEVLTKAITYAPARDAILTVFNGQGIVTRTDGEATMSGPVTAGLKKHPAPTAGNFHECMDWAREVQLIAEKAAGQQRQTMEEFSKAIRGRFEKLLKKRYDLAVEVVVYCYRMIEATSEPLAAATLEAIEDSSIAPAVAGKQALAGLKAAQQGHATTTATAATA